MQIRVNAKDGGSPPLIDTTVVSVKVDRNLNKPSFEPTSYQARILETAQIGELIKAVTAKDADKRVNIVICWSKTCYEGILTKIINNDPNLQGKLRLSVWQLLLDYVMLKFARGT